MSSSEHDTIDLSRPIQIQPRFNIRSFDDFVGRGATPESSGPQGALTLARIDQENPGGRSSWMLRHYVQHLVRCDAVGVILPKSKLRINLGESLVLPCALASITKLPEHRSEPRRSSSQKTQDDSIRPPHSRRFPK